MGGGSRSSGKLYVHYNNVPYYYNGPYVGLDESHRPDKGAPPTAALITANGYTLQIATPGITIDANLAAMYIALRVPALQEGSAALFFDSDAAIKLAEQAASCYPGGSFPALVEQFGPRLALISRAMHNKDVHVVNCVKTISHVTHDIIGRADHAIVEFNGMELPNDCLWVPKWCWPIELVGLHSFCSDDFP